MPTFDEFPLSSPPNCNHGEKDYPPGCPKSEYFSALEPDTNPDQIGNAHGEFASQLGANPGILGIFETDFSNGPLGCSSNPEFGTAFVYGSGVQSATNSYDISPGHANSAWKVPVTLADCGVEFPAVAGGPSGFGVLEDNDATNQTVYHQFDQATERFDTPVVTVANEFEEQPAVSQDGAGGVYATYLAGFGGEIRLAYSYNGGTTWSGPATLNPDKDGGAGHLTSYVNAAGQGWVTWIDNGSIYAQPFLATDSVPPPAADTITTSQTSATTTGANLTIAAGTTGETDRATIAGVNAPTASGTVAYTLYSASSCAASSKVFSSTGAVTSGVVAPSAPVTSALAPGTYYWQAVYSGNSGSVFGSGGNLPSVSACGSEALTVAAAPDSGYKLEHIKTSSGGTITITLVPDQSGKATVVVTVPTASIASVWAAAAKSKQPKRCKRGQIKLKGKCRPASTVVGRSSAEGTAGAELRLTVHLSSKIKAQLRKGKSVHLIATLTYRSALGGEAAANTYHLTVRGHRAKKKR